MQHSLRSAAWSSSAKPRAARRSSVCDPWSLVERNQSIIGFGIFGFAETPAVIHDALSELVGFVLSGKVTLESGGSMPLAKAADAHRLIEDRKSTGKIVLQPWADDRS